MWTTYTRQLGGAERHELSGGGVWLDQLSLRERESTDIRITSEGGDLGLGTARQDRTTRTNEPVSYVIEILSVRITAPTAAPAATPAPAT